jgi:hypothetical protein
MHIITKLFWVFFIAFGDKVFYRNIFDILILTYSKYLEVTVIFDSLFLSLFIILFFTIFYSLITDFNYWFNKFCLSDVNIPKELNLFLIYNSKRKKFVIKIYQNLVKSFCSVFCFRVNQLYKLKMKK